MLRQANQKIEQEGQFSEGWKLEKRANIPEVDCRQVENDFSGLLENFLRVSGVAKLEGHKDKAKTRIQSKLSFRPFIM